MSLRSLKDSFLAGLAKRGLATKLSRYGELQGFSIDTLQHTISAKLLLAGEQEPIDLIVTSYHLAEENDKLHIVIDAASCSREWMNNLIDDFLIGVSFTLPNAAKYALGKPDQEPN